MRVLHVITTLAPAGAAHQLRLLVRDLPHDCEVATLSRHEAPSRPLIGPIRAGGTRVHELGSDGEHPLTGVAALRRLIRRGRFDLVHTHLYQATVQGRLAAGLAGVPGVATEHAIDDGFDARPAAGGRWLYLAGERLGGVTIAVSPAVASRLREWGVPGSRIAVVPKAVDVTEFRYDPALRAAARARLGIAPDATVVGGLGRLEPGKRFDRLIRAVTDLPDATLLLVGDGSARVALERLAEIEGVADRVVFAGPVGHAREMLCAMDVFASPTDREPSGRQAFGLSVLEAMAAGLPALYATCPPLERLAAARAAVRGTRRFSSRDPQSLRRALRAELLCFEERRRERLAPRTAGHRYDAGHVAASVERIYERVGRRRGLIGPARRRRSSPCAANTGPATGVPPASAEPAPAPALRAGRPGYSTSGR